MSTEAIKFKDVRVGDNLPEVSVFELDRLSAHISSCGPLRAMSRPSLTR